MNVCFNTLGCPHFWVLDRGVPLYSLHPKGGGGGGAHGRGGGGGGGFIRVDRCHHGMQFQNLDGRIAI